MLALQGLDWPPFLGAIPKELSLEQVAAGELPPWHTLLIVDPSWVRQLAHHAGFIADVDVRRPLQRLWRSMPIYYKHYAAADNGDGALC